MNFVQSSLLVGAIGDVGLQVMTEFTDWGKTWGFERYFQKHGPLSSIFIASGMMGLIALGTLTFIGTPTVANMAVVGGGLDVLFRCAHPIIMPELSGYYASLDPFWTVLWGIIPMELALFFSK